MDEMNIYAMDSYHIADVLRMAALGYEFTFENGHITGASRREAIGLEDKQEILDKLTIALKATRAQHDLVDMVFDPIKETVRIVWRGGTGTVNVKMDSGIAMIRDVLRYIEYN